ncbi:hypothetical protein CANTEDRAFT_108128 [Yamadazyma tenuis ATCC 10573]|uniref:superoxide dismutase n=1 Tax=Candida tenuis (strain ATCC 10573 / BCRC 21748 / CBS 615 / JCM 9827 / NBRC 10315 / NRRL Y-1498 / VKM Y-70) TaxID=590646 RepID=G3B8N5_CANTC|nr:uncharacterized protein CANTEDRAFT_108128 [Yamadazyma tenuis ATCC 10573]EGV61775.1 hypothetical protein CANTEDRAFT_108128 [Yamadazyma tenuis ATCC 10573]
MRFQKPILLALAAALVTAGEAPKIKKNPADVVAVADFPSGGPQKILGNVVFTAKKGKAVNVYIDVTKLPKEGGPFQYHIHQQPIGANGDCEASGTHLNPYKASPDCDSQKTDAFCQVGDLSGKHGWIDTTCFETKYDDPYLSLNTKSKSNIIGKAIVFHFANLTKFACANIEVAGDVRLKSLEEEYSRNGNDDLNELKSFVANDYQFVPGQEVFEVAEAHSKRDLGVSQYAEIDEDDNDDDTEQTGDVPDCTNSTHHHSGSNYSNFTNLSTIDCENNADSLGWAAIPAILSGVAAVFLL